MTRTGKHRKDRRKVQRRLWILFFMLVAGLGMAGCESGAMVGPCGDGCPEGKICNFETGQCVDPRPPDCPVDLGRYLSVAADSTGRTVFSSYTTDYGDLVVGKIRSDSTMSCEYVDGLGGDVGLYSSLSVDHLDRPRVAYFDRTNGRLKYAQKNAEGWEVVTVPRAGSEDHVVGRSCSLALDSAGLPHIAFLDETAGALNVARKASDGRWAVEVVAGASNGDWPGTLGGEVGRMISVVLDTKDREWIAYRDIHTGSIKVAGRQPDGWTVIEVQKDTDLGSWISAALDRDGNMALAYHDRDEGTLKYAWNQGGSLKQIVADPGEEAAESGAVRKHPVGQHCALAFGRDALPRILYLDGATLELKLVVGKPEGGFLEPEVLSADGAVGFFNSLALGPDGLHAGSCRIDRNQQGAPRAAVVHFRLDAGTTTLGGRW
jgi:hypothetical protein